MFKEEEEEEEEEVEMTEILIHLSCVPRMQQLLLVHFVDWTQVPRWLLLHRGLSKPPDIASRLFRGFFAYVENSLHP